MTALAQRTCRPVPPGTPPLSESQIRQWLAELPGWEIRDGQLTKTFAFPDYYQTTAFLNATAWVSHRQDHHPEILLGYNRITLRYSTHSVKGLSENDFICAARVEALL
ncbi:MAG: 4a-hydroxytetrahydrobiopterin dehydratase [Phycisphaerae bacterium]|nr:4a-hydroxytetrahydrobiopterin dehydratase [Phycisphaerae bacterium]MDW8262246.1 4a-hydroxytetrahydrobiopterin dehydratase [Phycisphaerales bacterium]